MVGVVVLAVVGGLLWTHPAKMPPQPTQRPTQQATLTPPTPTPPPAPTIQPAPEFTLQTATEDRIRTHVAAGLTVFRFASNPRIVVLDFASLHQQGMMLNRIAALLEKGGTPRDHVLNDAELDQAVRAGGDTVETYYYGHDYSAASMARFFALADQQQATLNPEEETLRRLLTQLGWLTPGSLGGLISIPKVGADAHVTESARTAILHHELSHGEYFSNPTYAAYVHQFWLTALTAGERDAVRRFLAGEEYDTGLEELVENEMQAYLMFTRDPAFFTAAHVSMTPTRLAELQTAFLRNLPSDWLRDALAQVAPTAAR